MALASSSRARHMAGSPTRSPLKRSLNSPTKYGSVSMRFKDMAVMSASRTPWQRARNRFKGTPSFLKAHASQASIIAQMAKEAKAKKKSKEADGALAQSLGGLG